MVTIFWFSKQSWYTGSSLQLQVWSFVVPCVKEVLRWFLIVIWEFFRKEKERLTSQSPLCLCMIPCSPVSRSFPQPINLSAAVCLTWTTHRRTFSTYCHLSKWVSWRLFSSWMSVRSSGTKFLFHVSKSVKRGCIGWLISVPCKSWSPKVFQREGIPGTEPTTEECSELNIKLAFSDTEGVTVIQQETIAFNIGFVIWEQERNPRRDYSIWLWGFVSFL